MAPKGERVVLTTKVEAELAKRIERFVGNLNRSQVIRACLIYGIDAIEKDPALLLTLKPAKRQ